MKKLLSILVCVMIAMSSFGFVGCNREEGSLKGGKADVTYTISVEDAVNGSLTADKNKVIVGESVTFTFAPENGYVLEGLYLNGSKVAVVDNTYTVKFVLRNYTAKAVYAVEDVVVSFDGEGTSGFGDKIVAFGDAYGELPSPLAQGKTFVRWVDEDGNTVTAIDKVSALDGTTTLTAEYTNTPEALKEMHTPFAITTTYYNDEATEYGVVWHTRQEPIAPRLLIVEGDGSTGFENARAITGENFKWSTTDYGFEWLHRLVIDDLKFDTTYSVKMGDYCVDAWSKVYTFTTRKEVVDSAKFLFLTDSQENQHTASQNGKDTYSSQTILNAMNKHEGDFDFIAHGGDIVNDGGYPCRWDEMLDSYEDTLFEYPFQVTGGNHAEPSSYNKVDNPHSANKLFNYDEQETDPAKAARGPLYSFNYGPIHFVSLRSNDGLSNGYRMEQTQIDWFIQDVTEARQNPNIKWVIVQMHQGPIIPSFSSLNSNAFTSIFGPQLMPVIDQLDIDLLLYGHNHYIDSTYPLVWDNSITEVGVDNLKMSAVTKNIEKVTYDGDTVDKFVYANGTTDRGTVFHQTGACGNQVTGTVYKWSELAQNLAKLPNYRMLLSCGAAASPIGKEIQMYSYIEVTATTLVLRTYGVRVDDQLKGSISNDHNYYLDGFMLTK